MVRFPLICVVLFSSVYAVASPSQYFAQVYSEILGRSPEPSEWVANEHAFDEASASVGGISNVITSFFQSAEFRNLNYNTTEQAYVLYRAILLREPGTSEMQSVMNRISGGSSVALIARDMMNSAEFNNLVANRIKSPRKHAFINTTPSDRPTLGSTGIGNGGGGSVQEALIAAAPGDTVFLKRGAVIRVFRQLIIPAGVTLATYDSGSEDHIYRNRNAYAAMGRIVRAKMFNKPMIRIEPGGRLIGVWVDGRRSELRVNDRALKNPALSSDERFQFSHNISLLGGQNGSQVSEVSHCKLSDSTGWTALHAQGFNAALAPGFTKIANNMITSYSASRSLEESFYTDGISNASSDAVIINNDIIDSSDVGIVLFNPGMVTGQRSQVVGNSILFAGIDGWGGITMDHSVKIKDFCKGVNPNGIYNCFDVGNDAISSSFEGVLIQNNQIWSSDARHANVGISMGVQLWGLRMFGDGGQVVQNKLGSSQQPLNAGVGIVVSGIRQPVVLENELNLKLDQSYVSCYSTPLLLDPSATTLNAPGAMIQSNFVTGETWALLHPKSNGFVFGNYNLKPFNQATKSVAVQSSTLKIQDLSNDGVSDDWMILHSERDFGDGEQYYLIKNRGNHHVIEAADGLIRVGPFSATDSQYWRLEAFDGVALGNGVRLANRVTGEFLARDANGDVFATNSSFLSATNWKFQRIETRSLDQDQAKLLFVDVYGEMYQVYLDEGRIFQDRSVGNLNADLGISMFAENVASVKSLGLSDFNSDGRFDAAFLLENGGLFVAFQSASGFANGALLGNMRTKWGWDINKNARSWEKPVGFVDMGGSNLNDLVVVDLAGNLEVGFINADGLGDTKELGAASSIGLNGLTSSSTSTIKSVGSGDFDGDGDDELLFVGAAGGLFRVEVNGGTLQNAVGIGNPVDKFGFAFTSSSESHIKPVGIADVNGDNVDDVIMIESSGYLLAYIMKNGTFSSAINLGSPQRTWKWKMNSQSRYTLPLGLSYGNGWWGW